MMAAAGWRLALACLAAGPAPAAPPGAGSAPLGAEACLGCHADKSVAPDPRIQLLGRSAHQRVACDACHGDAAEAPHAPKLKAVDCAGCHAKAASGLKSTAHGRAILRVQGRMDRACGACHGSGHGVGRSQAAGSPASKARQPETCGACHEDPAAVPARVLAKHPVETFRKTVHGEALAAGKGATASCSDCHGSHDVRPSSDAGSWLAGPAVAATCGRCHPAQAKAFAASVHGAAAARGARAAPTCTDCHGEHDIRHPREAGSRLAPGARGKTCSDCHQSARLASRFGLPADRVTSFEASFHGLAGKGGDVRVADCASCHGWHDVLPSSAPGSRVHPARLAETCGQCHPGAGKRWAAGGVRVHETLSREGGGSRAARLVALFYGLAIPLTAALMLLHNGLDLARKARAPGTRRHREGEAAPTVSERWQHAANALAFLLLAYSGFALQHPGAWWATALRWLGGEEARRDAHRAAAALFLLTGAAHLAYLASAPGRARLRALLPARRDLADPLRVLAYNAGTTGERPRLLQFSYIEKFEYWALLWGSFVMTLTGALLLFHNAALAWLPLWTVEVARVAHYLEAVLACMAIGLWHGYWVALDPEVYPMNWAWLTGETNPPARKGER